MTEKKCSKCGEVKLFSEFNKDSSRQNGHRSSCKACNKEYRENNKEKISKRKREYYEANKDRLSEYHRKWYEKNRNHVLEYQIRYNQENRDYVIERSRKRYQENKDRILENLREYKKANSDKVLANCAKRRALKKSTATTDPWELEQITLFYGDLPKGYHVDHIIPLHLGGRHELCNLQHLERFLNLDKHYKHPDDWDDPRPISCRA